MISGGHYGKKVDVWSFGAMLTELLTLRAVSAAYKRLCMENHPDRAAQNGLTVEQATAAMQVFPRRARPSTCFALLQSPRECSFCVARPGAQELNQAKETLLREIVPDDDASDSDAE